VTRSKSFGLVVSKADDQEIADSITPEMHEDLGLALGGALTEMKTADPAELFATVTTVVRLLGQHMTPAGRKEWIAGVVDELIDLPGEMVLDALARCRRCVTDDRKVVKWVCDEVDPRAALLRIEVERLTKLVNFAFPPA
jgi:hypothetical protein